MSQISMPAAHVRTEGAPARLGSWKEEGRRATSRSILAVWDVKLTVTARGSLKRSSKRVTPSKATFSQMILMSGWPAGLQSLQ